MLASGPSTMRMTSATVTVSGRHAQPVAAVGAAAAVDQAVAAQLGEDVLEELDRHGLGLGDAVALHGPVAAEASSIRARSA